MYLLLLLLIPIHQAIILQFYPRALFLTLVQALPLLYPPALFLRALLLKLYLLLGRRVIPTLPVIISARHITNDAIVQSSPSPKATPPAISQSVTQQVLYTTTLSNGGVSTITSVTVVPADQADTSAGSSTSTARASVQTNSAKSGKILSINGVLGALGLIMVVSAL